MMKKFIYIANWKSYFTYDQSIAWLKMHGEALNTLSENNNIMLCPDFLTLVTACLKKAPHQLIKYGAQNCSAYSAGAYTGEISAQSLSELGIATCIVGHSERRQLFHETLDDTQRKITMLFEYNITPLVCVSDDYTRELHVLLPYIQQMRHIKTTELIIAYEPISAIGTGRLPAPEAIERVLAEIKHTILQFLPHASCSLLYGGSVCYAVVHELKRIPALDGFLIGKASTDFQELKNIVECK